MSAEDANDDDALARFYEEHPEAAAKWTDDGLVMGFLGVTGEKQEATTNTDEDTLDTVYEVLNVFCPTGEGGGVDPTCSPKTDPVHDKVVAFLREYRENYNNRGANADSIAEYLGLSHKETLAILREMKAQGMIAPKKYGWGRRGNVKYTANQEGGGDGQ